MPRPIHAAPPADLPEQTIDHIPDDVGLDPLPTPNDSAPFPILDGIDGLPDAADPGIEMSEGHMPDLPDFLL